jgi:hypothetical protein
VKEEHVMKGQQEFTIDQVSWHTKGKDNPESPEMVRRRFRILADFLQDNGLTVRVLLAAGGEPKDDLAIRSTDLTDEGLAVVRKAYDKWLKKIVNKRKDLSDGSVLSKALNDIRGPGTSAQQ